MNSSTECIGVIGLGLLGSAIVARFRESGLQVVGYDLNPDACKCIETEVIRVAENVAEVLASARVCVLCLPDSDAVAGLLNECRPRLQPGQIFLDTTTGDPEVMSALANELAALNVTYLETNVAGSSSQMRLGQACLFIGGDDNDDPLVRKAIDAMSRTQFRVGPVGNGSKLKLVHNLILGLHRAVLAEGLSFGESLGIVPSLLLEVLQQTPAASAVMSTKGSKMTQRDYAPQAKLSQHLKDVRLILVAAERSGAYTPLSEIHRKLLEEAESWGLGDADNTAIYEVFRASSLRESEN